MSIITLTTDFGYNDSHVASIKGAIYSQLPEVTLVDISHDIEPFNLLQAAYVLGTCFQSFPKKTVHIVGVDALYYEDTKPLAVEVDDHYFICNDNGIISLITSEIAPSEIVEITINKYEKSQYLIRDLFIPVACYLANGGKLNVIGQKRTNIKELVSLRPTEKQEDNTLIGMIIFVDNYGNVITNIREKQFYSFGKKRNFTIYARNHKFDKIFENYTDIVTDFSQEISFHGNKLAIFNSAGNLQISLYKSNQNTVGGASSLLGLAVGDMVRVVFEKI